MSQTMITKPAEQTVTDAVHADPTETAMAQRKRKAQLAGSTVQNKEIQRKVTDTLQQAKKPNETSLPDNLKAGVENLSGISLEGLKVHYNSDKPAQLNTHAYAQGTDIHVAPGQEQHLPHEAWHVVQQGEGRCMIR